MSFNQTLLQVLLKNGFKYKGAITNAVIKDGNVYNLLIYRLTKDCNENLTRFKKIK